MDDHHVMFIDDSDSVILRNTSSGVDLRSTQIKVASVDVLHGTSTLIFGLRNRNAVLTVPVDNLSQVAPIQNWPTDIPESFSCIFSHPSLVRFVLTFSRCVCSVERSLARSSLCVSDIRGQRRPFFADVCHRSRAVSAIGSDFCAEARFGDL